MSTELNQPVAPYKPEGIPVTPYLRAKEIWDNRIGTARLQAYNWRLAFFGALGLCLLLVIGLIFQSAKASVVPYIVEVGPGGEVIAATRALQANRAPNDPEVKYFVSKWIQDVRQVPLDIVLKKRSWMSAYAAMRTKAALKMNEMLKKDDPMSRIGQETVAVTPAAIVKMSDNTYQIRWTEDVYSKEGAPKTSYRMTGLITLDFSRPTTEKDMMTNPLGLYVTDFSWSKEL